MNNEFSQSYEDFHIKKTAFTICPGGTNSLWMTSCRSKKQMSMDFCLDFLIHTWGVGKKGCAILSSAACSLWCFKHPRLITSHYIVQKGGVVIHMMKKIQALHKIWSYLCSRKHSHDSPSLGVSTGGLQYKRPALFNGRMLIFPTIPNIPLHQLCVHTPPLVCSVAQEKPVLLISEQTLYIYISTFEYDSTCGLLLMSDIQQILYESWIRNFCYNNNYDKSMLILKIELHKLKDGTFIKLCMLCEMI